MAYNENMLLSRPWQDWNLQSSDPKSNALSIRPHGPHDDLELILDLDHSSWKSRHKNVKSRYPKWHTMKICFFHDHDRTQTCNPQIQSLMPYPLGHMAHMVTMSSSLILITAVEWAVINMSEAGIPNGQNCIPWIYASITTMTGLKPAILRSEVWCLIH